MISEIVTKAGSKYVADQGPYPLFSVLDWQRGATDTSVRLFNYTMGQRVSRTAKTVAAPVRQATIRDTNVQTAGKMAAQEGMLVTSVRNEMTEAQVAVGSTDGDASETYLIQQPAMDLRNLILASRLMSLELWISKKPYERHSPLWYAAGYGALAAIATGTDSASIYVGNNGVPSHDAARYVPTPYVILPSEEYWCDLRNPTGRAINWFVPTGGTVSSTQVRFKITLDGQRVRDVGVLGSKGVPAKIFERPVVTPYNMRAA